MELEFCSFPWRGLVAVDNVLPSDVLDALEVDSAELSRVDEELARPEVLDPLLPQRILDGPLVSAFYLKLALSFLALHLLQRLVLESLVQIRFVLLL